LKYTVKGVGTKPQKQQSPIIMKTETGVSTTTNVDFQNPANHPIRCDLSISSGNKKCQRNNLFIENQIFFI
jgi:hypothetical protein